MYSISRIRLGFRALQQLGIQPVALQAVYQAGLKLGFYRRRTPIHPPHSGAGLPTPGILLFLPTQSELAACLPGKPFDLFDEANQLAAGQIRLFGGDPVPLQLSPSGPLRHWCFSDDTSTDMKVIWEPARLGWAFTLARAYRWSQDEKYAATFWGLAETFWEANPPNAGPNWSSAQEVALRILALSFAVQVFTSSPYSTPARKQHLLGSIYDHAARIPATLIYARAQNNNHLLSDAAGLYTAGIMLDGIPEADAWRAQGWKWFQQGLQKQIAPDGTYIQHSTNYHRLMLQLALWMVTIAKTKGQAFPQSNLERLSAATHWLLDQLDSSSGQVPNLGHNDGAYILPLAEGGFEDYRPTLQAAAAAFLGKRAFPPGPWDEFNLWLGLRPTSSPQRELPILSSPAIHRLGSANCWASLRAAQYSARPAHADQLHVELWWNGHNIAQDAGTYRYTAPAPWQNGLASTSVHNTIKIDGLDQMTRAGRFLWLDWAQARMLSNEQNIVSAEHDGYQKLELLHRRTLRFTPPSEFTVRDEILPLANHPTNPHDIVLHWLLPDWPWQFADNTIRLTTPENQVIRLSVSLYGLSGPTQPLPVQSQIIRAGQVVSGPSGEAPILGWYSPSYAALLPALSVRFALQIIPPVTLISQWSFPSEWKPPE